MVMRILVHCFAVSGVLASGLDEKNCANQQCELQTCGPGFMPQPGEGRWYQCVKGFVSKWDQDHGFTLTQDSELNEVVIKGSRRVTIEYVGRLSESGKQIYLNDKRDNVFDFQFGEHLFGGSLDKGIEKMSFKQCAILRIPDARKYKNQIYFDKGIETTILRGDYLELTVKRLVVDGDIAQTDGHTGGQCQDEDCCAKMHSRSTCGSGFQALPVETRFGYCPTSEKKKAGCGQYKDGSGCYGCFKLQALKQLSPGLELQLYSTSPDERLLSPRSGASVTIEYVGRISRSGKQFYLDLNRGNSFTFKYGDHSAFRLDLHEAISQMKFKQRAILRISNDRKSSYLKLGHFDGKIEDADVLELIMFVSKVEDSSANGHVKAKCIDAKTCCANEQCCLQTCSRDFKPHPGEIGWYACVNKRRLGAIPPIVV